MTATARYQRRKSGGDILATLIADVIMALVGGWLFMLAIGIVHHEWIRSCPTIGFFWSVTLAALVRGALFLNGAAKSDS